MMDGFISYLITALAVTVSLIFIYFKWSFTYWQRRNIPYLQPSFPFGNFKNVLTSTKSQSEYYKEFYNEFKKMGKKFGGIYTFLAPTFMLIDPEFNKQILVKDFPSFHARGLYVNERDQPVAANLFFTDGEKWKNLRTKLSPTFTPAKMKQMFNLMTAVSDTMDIHIKQYVDSKTPVDIKDFIGRLTTDIFGSCALGIDCNSFEDTRLQTTLAQIFAESANLAKFIFCNALPTLAQFLHVKSFPEKKVNIITTTIEDTIKVRRQNDITRNDFLQTLIEMEQKGILTMDEIKGHCLLFFLGGYETSATTITFTLFELACNQDIQDKVRNEIHEILSKYNNVLTYEGLNEMKYLQMVVDETLRKYPPMPIIIRKSVENYTLPNSNVKIEKGTQISIPVLGLHFDPDYFPNPEKYDPERFSEENKTNIVPYTYLPFGDGPRNCLGDRFGKLQVRVGLAALINKYKFTLNPQMKLPLEFTADLVPTSKQKILLDFKSIS